MGRDESGRLGERLGACGAVGRNWGRAKQMDRNLSRLAVAGHKHGARRGVAQSANIIATGLLVTAMMVVAQAASQLIDFLFFDLRLRAIDSNHHASVFGAASLLAQASAGAAIAVRVASSERRMRWVFVAGLVGALLIIRTFIRHQATTAMLLLPLAAVFFSVGWLTLRDPANVRSVVWGALFLLMCSFALHTIGPQAERNQGHRHDHTVAYQLAGIVKHGTELAGWMLLATGMAAAALAIRAQRAGHLRCSGAQT
jgi:hypothetical protein